MNKFVLWMDVASHGMRVEKLDDEPQMGLIEVFAGTLSECRAEKARIAAQCAANGLYCYEHNPVTGNVVRPKRDGLGLVTWE